MTPQRRQALEKIVLHATTLRIPIVEVEGGSLTALAGFDGHQGVLLEVGEREYEPLPELLDRLRRSPKPPFVLLLVLGANVWHRAPWIRALRRWPHTNCEWRQCADYFNVALAGVAIALVTITAAFGIAALAGGLFAKDPQKAAAVAKARALASHVEVTAMRHRLTDNRPGPFGPLDQPIIRIDVTYRTPAGRTR